MTPARLYIASVEAEALERIFSEDPAFAVLGSAGRGDAALEEIFRLMPDVLALDEVLTGGDGRAVLKHLEEMAAPPRVLLLKRTAVENPSGLNAAIAYPCGAPALLRAARQAAQDDLPAPARRWSALRERIADELLDRLGVPTALKGRAYMQTASAAGACAPQLLASLSGRMYPYAARIHHTTPGAVEKAIRTAVEHTWLHGSLSAIQALFGFSVDAEKGKPTNAEFLAMLCEHVRREMAKAICRHGEA